MRDGFYFTIVLPGHREFPVALAAGTRLGPYDDRGAAMTREETTDLFARRLDAMNRHDVAGLTTLYAQDCVVESPTAGGVVEGLPTVSAIDRAWFTGFPDVVFTTEDLLIDGEHVAWIGRAEGTDTGGFLDCRRPGRRSSCRRSSWRRSATAASYTSGQPLCRRQLS